ncbi:MAG: tRNA isopentenyl-2-thiomethyl-A-37 hydroxylase MiaE [Polyangiaceae bacterium]
MLGLLAPTDPNWAPVACANLDATLIDHAHCELKAATNAMSLVARYPDELDLVLALSALAAEELEHFRIVVEHLKDRGLQLGTPPVDDYAAALRKAAHALPQRHIERLILVDRLLVGALIEARSCERFRLLLSALGESEATLRTFYEELFAAEAKHFRTYVDLAKLAAREHAHLVDERLTLLAEHEARIVRDLYVFGPRPSIHG